MFTILLVIVVYAGPQTVSVHSQQIGRFTSEKACLEQARLLTKKQTVKDYGNSYWRIEKSQSAECNYIGEPK